MPMNETSLEPLFPERHGPDLEDLACAIIMRAGQLQAKVRPQFREELCEVTRLMHCYYSNLIEGQQTRVPDIEAALRHDFSAEPKKRDLQKLALAHLECQRWAAGYSASPFAPDFICKLHQHFYSHLPAEMRVATTKSGSKIPFE